MDSVEQILKEHGLRLTKQRISLLGYILSEKRATSQPELEKFFQKDFDRVTIYRTLKSFLEAGLIHKVPDDDAVIKYALCQHTHCLTHQHQDEHIHFKCKVCGLTSCIDELPFPHFHSPKGYVFEETSILIQGVCNLCAV